MTIVAVRPNVAISTIPNRDARARIFIAGPFANTSPDNERLPEARRLVRSDLVSTYPIKVVRERGSCV